MADIVVLDAADEDPAELHPHLQDAFPLAGIHSFLYDAFPDTEPVWGDPDPGPLPDSEVLFNHSAIQEYPLVPPSTATDSLQLPLPLFPNTIPSAPPKSESKPKFKLILVDSRPPGSRKTRRRKRERERRHSWPAGTDDSDDNGRRERHHSCASCDDAGRSDAEWHEEDVASGMKAAHARNKRRRRMSKGGKHAPAAAEPVQAVPDVEDASASQSVAAAEPASRTSALPVPATGFMQLVAPMPATVAALAAPASIYTPPTPTATPLPIPVSAPSLRLMAKPRPHHRSAAATAAAAAATTTPASDAREARSMYQKRWREKKVREDAARLVAAVMAALDWDAAALALMRIQVQAQAQRHGVGVGVGAGVGVGMDMEVRVIPSGRDEVRARVVAALRAYWADVLQKGVEEGGLMRLS